MDYQQFIQEAREHIYLRGAENASNSQLLMTLLNKKADINKISLLVEKGVRELFAMSPLEIQMAAGLTEAQALQVHAALELGRRLSRVDLTNRPKISSPSDAANVVMDSLRHLHQEHFIVLFLNTKNHVIAQETIFVGTLNSSLVHPREVFREALRKSAASIILAHNHPSGDPQPSKEDLDVTQRLLEVGRIMGIEILDHIIIGDGIFVSLKEKGFM